MSTQVTYFYSHVSPWSFLGHRQLMTIATDAGAAIDFRPVSVAEIFPKTGGVPLAKRPPERRAYRMAELKRWPARLGLEINVEPKFFPADDKPAARLAIVAGGHGLDVGALSERIMSGTWQREEDIADRATLVAIAGELGHDGEALVAESEGEEADRRLMENCEKALADGCFGVPWYDVAGEPFWGQDRLDFVAARLGVG